MVIAIIPAKARSNRIPNKNKMFLCGKTLLERTIDCAKETGIDDIIVSSNSQEILTDVEEKDVIALKRPDFLCKADVDSTDVIIHVLDQLKINDDETVFMLLPTSPLRKSKHCKEALDLFDISRNKQSVVGVTRAPKFISLRYLNSKKNSMKPLKDLTLKELHTQSQFAIPVYQVNGAIFLSYAGSLRKSKTFLYLKRIVTGSSAMSSENFKKTENSLQRGCDDAVTIPRNRPPYPMGVYERNLRSVFSGVTRVVAKGSGCV